MKNKIYGLNLDALTICYEADFEVLNSLSEHAVGEKIDLDGYFLRKVEGKHYDHVFNVGYYDVDKDVILGAVKFGINRNKEESNTHANGKRKAWIRWDNRTLYNEFDFHVLVNLADFLGLKFHNYTTVDICLDMSLDVAHYLKRLTFNRAIDVILNGKKIDDKVVIRPELDFNYKSNLIRLKYPTMYVKQKKAVKDKTKGATLIAYDKNAEIKYSSGKYYISEYYGKPKKLNRLEVHLNNKEIKDFFGDMGQNEGLLFERKLLANLYYDTLNRLIRYELNGKKLDWWDILHRPITTPPATPTKSKSKRLALAN